MKFFVNKQKYQNLRKAYKVKWFFQYILFKKK